jgi:flagellar motility protein MotE (MotC chaperone)
VAPNGSELIVSRSIEQGVPAPWARLALLILWISMLGGGSVAESAVTEAAEKDLLPVSDGPSSSEDAGPAAKQGKAHGGKDIHGSEGSASIQGPATSVPREILEMLERRRRMLDRREAALRGAETHLLELKAELEQILTRFEKTAEAQKRRHEAAAKAEADRKAREDRDASEHRNVHQSQLAKIYEAMPPEEAAVRLERMPERKAIEVLRLLKGKSAGAILAVIRPERAAHLTEQLLNVP